MGDARATVETMLQSGADPDLEDAKGCVSCIGCTIAVPLVLLLIFFVGVACVKGAAWVYHWGFGS